MVSKVLFTVVLAIAFFQMSEASVKTALEEDFQHLLKPVNDAVDTLKHHMQEIAEKIKANPIFKNAAGAVSEKYHKAQDTLVNTYDKLASCRKIIFNEIPPVVPHIPQIPQVPQIPEAHQRNTRPHHH